MSDRAERLDVGAHVGSGIKGLLGGVEFAAC